MPTITDIAVQKNNGQRFNIFLDGTFAFGVSEETLSEFSLRKGSELTETQVAAIKESNTFYVYYAKAIHYISYALRTEKQVREKLAQIEDCDSLMVDKVIQKLKDDRYLNDVVYTQTFIQNALLLTKKGKNVLAQELYKKGIAPTIIKDELSKLDASDELEAAIDVATKYIRRQKNISQKQLLQKTTRHLVQKGYSFHIANQVIQSLDFSQSDEDEWQHLCTQGEPIWKRYTAKYTGYDVKQKTTTALLNKGYNLTMIKRFIAMKGEENDA